MYEMGERGIHVIKWGKEVYMYEMGERGIHVIKWGKEVYMYEMGERGIHVIKWGSCVRYRGNIEQISQSVCNRCNHTFAQTHLCILIRCFCSKSLWATSCKAPHKDDDIWA